MLIDAGEVKSFSLAIGNGQQRLSAWSSDGFVLPPFLIVQGEYHLASWYTDTIFHPPGLSNPHQTGGQTTRRLWIGFGTSNSIQAYGGRGYIV